MSKKSALSIAASLTIFGAAALFIVAGNGYHSDAQAAAAQPPAVPVASTPAPALQAQTQAQQAQVPDTLTDKDVAEITAARTMGKPDAPVKMTEYASLSCPHCARFSQTVFPQMQKDYIDTGKVFYTYVDFPLNAPALKAAAVALCLPQNVYFRYIDFLFKTQDKWAYDNQNPEIMLIQNAKLLGGDGDKLAACAQSDKLKHAIVDRMQAASKQFDINATPSFVINGDKNDKFMGEVTYDMLKKTLDAHLAGKGKPSQ